MLQRHRKRIIIIILCSLIFCMTSCEKETSLFIEENTQEIKENSHKEDQTDHYQVVSVSYSGESMPFSADL